MTPQQTSRRRLAALGDSPFPADSLQRLRAFQAQTLDAVLWDHDLDRVAALTAAAVGAPVAIVVPHLQLVAAAPAGVGRLADELAAHVADRLRRRPTEVPARVLAEAPIVRRGEPLGAVFLLAGDGGGAGAGVGNGPGRSPATVGARAAIPAGDELAAAPYLDLAATAALTRVAAVELAASIEQELHGSLLEQLLGDEPLDPQRLAQRAARLGCDLSDGAVALCLRPADPQSRQALALLTRERPGALAEQLGERVYAIVPCGDDRGETARVQALVQRLRPHGVVATSRHHPGATDLRHALEEAELVLDVLALSDAPVDVERAMSGTYRLLFRLLATHPGEVEALYRGTVASLVAYDEHHRTDLLATLETYLELNGNMNATAARIYAHRHTVAYRLDRIRELTDLDPAEGEDRERLGLGLKAHRLLNRARRG